MSITNTKAIAGTIAGARLDDFDEETIRVARQCMLDWFAVTLAGVAEPCGTLLTEELSSQSGEGVPLVGRPEEASLMDAALINGTTSHALDYDDVSMHMPGHPTVPVLSALIPLAQEIGANGRDLLEAFVIGYEAQCLVGSLVSPSHYANGFHTTATVGSFGAAAGCAALLKLGPDVTGQALGLAGTQAAGLKSMFGTMAKPFHAGRAAANGLMAARLAARGFTAAADVLDVEQGFVDTQSEEDRGRVVDLTRFGTAVRQTLFKYHAACYMTHSAIEAAADFLASRPDGGAEISRLSIHVPRTALGVCNIQDPTSALENKFSLRQVVAMRLLGRDTASLTAYSDETAEDPNLAALRQKITVVGDHEEGGSAALTVDLVDSTSVSVSANVAVPATDLGAQETKLIAKFRALSDPFLGSATAAELQQNILHIDRLDGLDRLIAMTHPDKGGSSVARVSQVTS